MKRGYVMKIEVFGLESAIDGTLLSVLSMKPEEKPKAIIQILHGMSEHKERYIPFMEYLVNQGFACIIHDHRGHGASVENKRDYGYFGKNGAYSIVSDAKQVGEFIKDDYPELPFYLLGHSMGSLIARMYLKKYEAMFDGVILSGSPSKNPFVGFGLTLVKLLEKFQDEKTPSRLINKLATGANDMAFEGEVKNAWLCSDEEIVKAYNEDERDGFCFTLNGFEALFLLMGSVYDKKHWKVKRKGLPILFISGKDDPCRINDKSFHSAILLMNEVGYENMNVKEYEGMRHEILNEVKKEAVYQDIVNWLNECMNQKEDDFE